MEIDFRIYFTDLTEDAKKRFLEANGVADSAELNVEYSPIAIVMVDSGKGEDCGEGPLFWDV